MKKLLNWLGFIVAILFMVPALLIFIGGHYNENLVTETSSLNEASIKEREEKIRQLVGIVAKEMPSSYSIEAKKAQAVLVRTYLLRREKGEAVGGELSGYTLEEMKTMWQGEFDKIYEQYKEAILATDDMVVTYEGALIEPIYHSASAGHTRNGKEVYGMEIPYLQPVESEWDDQVVTVVEIDKKEMVEVLKGQYPGIIIEEQLLDQQIQVIDRYASGYIGNIQVGNHLMSGEELKNLFKLPSSYFEFVGKGNKIIFTVRGTGTGVGFSKNGANELAKGGTTYEELIRYYFTGIEIEKVDKNIYSVE